MKKWFAAIALCIGLVLPSAVGSGYRISNDYGGELTKYIAKYSMLSAAEGKVEFEGVCASACTLALNFIKPENGCSLYGSKWGFHTATLGEEEYSQEGTDIAWAFYPEWVKTLLDDHGLSGKEAHPTLVWFPGITFYKECA